MGKETLERTTLVDEDIPVYGGMELQTSACLVRVFAPRVGLSFDAFTIPSSGLVIGRNPTGSDDILIEDQKASRRHAEIQWVADVGAHAVCDLKSTNGSFLNGVTVDRDFLQLGDVIRAGNSLFVYCLDPPEGSDDARFVGRSKKMREVIQNLEQVAPTDLKVLITGETGTGKELAALALHSASGRDGPFVPVNCGSFPASLIESELFGYVRGAFSGADRSKEGLIASADKGTLFLDEIGEFPLDLQPRLLRVLQDHEVRPVGATTSKRVDVRVIAATNRDIHAMVAEDRFRRDLLARVNEWPIDLPPLRERREDCGLLIRHFLRQRGAGAAVHEFNPDLLEHMLLALWEGNVRELAAAVARLAVSLSSGSTSADLLLRQVFGKVPQQLPVQREIPPPPTEQAELARVVALFEGNVSGVARHYGKERQQIYRWLEKLEITLK